MDFNVSALKNTTANEQGYPVVGRSEAIIAGIILLPVLYCTLTYLYLLRGLLKKKIWKQIPFYACFIALGISDCCLLFRYIITQCLLKIFMVTITARTPFIIQLIFTVMERIYMTSFNFSSCMLGMIAITRTVAITKPITYKQRWFDSAGKIVIIACGVISLVPSLLLIFAITEMGFFDSQTFEYIVIVPAPFPVSAEISEAVLSFVYLALPLLVGGILPMVLYPLMAHKLRSATTNNLLNSSQKKVETKFFIIGLTLSLAFISVVMIFIVSIPFYSYEESSHWVNLFLNIGIAAEALLASVNPFIYWKFDSTIRRKIPMPMWVPFLKKAPNVVSVTAASATQPPARVNNLV